MYRASLSPRLPSSSSSSVTSHRGRAGIAVRRAVATAIESLESRRLYSVTATAAGGVLSVTGDDNANAITVSRTAGGTLLVNGGAVQITGSPATVTTIQSLRIFGLGGNDNLRLDETRGVLPAASIAGGSGDDTVTGGTGADILRGGDGNDLLFGNAGNDQLLGGIGNDTLTGGGGTDQAFGEAGDDRMIWNPGDGSDLNEGGDGIDTVEINGGNVSETFTADGAPGGRVLFKRTDPAPFSIDIGTSEKLNVNAKGGDDTFTGGKGLAGVMTTTIDGGVGNDTLLGTDAADRLIGGDGNDFIDGNGGADVALMGSGNDTFRWDGGDGSDVIEGGTGNDTMVFNGAPGPENVDLSNNAGRLRFFRTQGAITMDTNDLEVVEYNALGGADNVVVHDLAGTDVRSVNLNLEGTSGKGDGDGAADGVTVEGTNGDDVIRVGSSGGDVSVTGLTAAVTIRTAEAGGDKLNVNAGGGNDAVLATGLAANAIVYAADGGTGNDLLIGSLGNDTLHGGDGDDFLLGRAGTDQLDGGTGHNVIVQ